MTAYLYTVGVSRDAIERDRPSDAQRLAQLTGTAGAQPAVESSGQQPGDLVLEGQFRDEFAETTATTLRQLAASDAAGPLALAVPNEQTPPIEGYYSAERAVGGRPIPQTDALARFNVTLSRGGSRGSHRRRVRTQPEQVSTPFGADSTGYVGVPADAQRVQWVSPDSLQRTPATPVMSTTAEQGTVDLFDVEQAPYPVDSRGRGARLIYDLDYAREGDVDAAVFDTRGRPETDAQGRFAWQQVFSPQHDFVGEAIIETGVIRLRIDTTTDPPTLTAEEWDDSAGDWTAVSLGSSSWGLYDYDIGAGPGGEGTIGPPRATARLVFRDSSAGSLYTVDATAHRGWDAIQFAEPDGSGTMPSGLQTLLDPVASASVIDSGARQDIVPRSNLPTL